MPSLDIKIKIAAPAFLILAIFSPLKTYAAWDWGEYADYNFDYASLSEEDCAEMSKTINLTTHSVIAAASCLAPDLSYQDNSMEINIIHTTPNFTKDGAQMWIHRSAQDAEERLKKDTDAWLTNDPTIPAEYKIDWKVADAKIGDGGKWITADSVSPWTAGSYSYGHARHLWFTLGKCFMKFEGTSSYLDQDQGPVPLENKIIEFARQLILETRDVCGGAVTSPTSTQPIINLLEVEALAEKQPIEDDLPISTTVQNDEKSWGEATVIRMTGGADMLLPGLDPEADSSWTKVKIGDVIPAGAKLFTSYASETTLEYANHCVIVVLALSEIKIDKPEDYVRTVGRLELGTGDVEFKVRQGDFRTDMQVTTPNATASPTGTHLRASYNKETGVTVYEIYDGSLLITSTLTGQQKTISSSYGQPIKRIEVAKGGGMTEQIAIPKDGWQTRKAETAPQVQPEERRGSGVLWVLFVLVLGGGTTFLYKKGKLKLVIQKVLSLVRRDKSKPL